MVAIFWKVRNDSMNEKEAFCQIRDLPVRTMKAPLKANPLRVREGRHNSVSKTYQHAIDIVCQIQEDQKVKVPLFVDKWIKQHDKYDKWGKLERFMCDYNRVDLPTAIYNYYDNNHDNSREKVVNAILYDYKVDGQSQWDVSVGDLVIRKGDNEAQVYFVEGIDIDGYSELITSILLVNGIKDEFYEDNIDHFFRNFRLLAKKGNLEAEV